MARDVRSRSARAAVGPAAIAHPPLPTTAATARTASVVAHVSGLLPRYPDQFRVDLRPHLPGRIIRGDRGGRHTGEEVVEPGADHDVLVQGHWATLRDDNSHGAAHLG